MDSDSHSINIDIPLLRVSAKSSNIKIKSSHFRRTLIRIMEKKRKKRKPSEISLQKYTLSDKKPQKLNKIKKEELLLPYKLFAKKQASDNHKQRLNIRIHDRYKIISTDLRNRLHVCHPPDDVCAVTDIDKSFYECVNGRPIWDRIPHFKSLKTLLSDQLRLKQDVSYRNDDILSIDINHRRELETYDKTFERFMEQTRYFDRFISEDYLKSMLLLSKWDELKIKVSWKISELHNLATEQFTIMSRLMDLDYLYRIQQKYGRFLYYLSPPSWRLKNREFARSVEIEAKGFDLGCSDEETFNVLFEKMQKECYGNLIKPVLYFTRPRDLLEIFKSIEKQQLHQFTYVTHLAPHTKIAREEIKMLKELISQDSTLLVNTISLFETLLEFSDERSAQLEKGFYSVLNGLFYQSVGAPEVLKLYLHLDFCYEKVYSEKPMNIGLVSMAKGLEQFYMDYNRRLEAVQNDKTKKAVKKSIETERKKFRRAKEAHRELQLFDRLERDLLRAYALAPSKHNLKKDGENITPIIPSIKTAPVLNTATSKGNSDKSAHKNLSESQMEYLTLFTDWIHNEDPAKYLHFE